MDNPLIPSPCMSIIHICLLVQLLVLLPPPVLSPTSSVSVPFSSITIVQPFSQLCQFMPQITSYCQICLLIPKSSVLVAFPNSAKFCLCFSDLGICLLPYFLPCLSQNLNQLYSLCPTFLPIFGTRGKDLEQCGFNYFFSLP